MLGARVVRPMPGRGRLPWSPSDLVGKSGEPLTAYLEWGVIRSLDGGVEWICR